MTDAEMAEMQAEVNRIAHELRDTFVRLADILDRTWRMPPIQMRLAIMEIRDELRGLAAQP